MSALPDSALPAPPALAGLTWRPLAKTDVPAMARLSLACYQADGEQSPQPEAEFTPIFDFLGIKWPPIPWLLSPRPARSRRAVNYCKRID
jgi:hypothetical protein